MTGTREFRPFHPAAAADSEAALPIETAVAAGGLAPGGQSVVVPADGSVRAVRDGVGLPA